MYRGWDRQKEQPDTILHLVIAQRERDFGKQKQKTSHGQTGTLCCGTDTTFSPSVLFSSVLALVMRS
jgi:hypothetical protein